jgi:hypothetical protein
VKAFLWKVQSFPYFFDPRLKLVNLIETEREIAENLVSICNTNTVVFSCMQPLKPLFD